jgi:hypothetical protein
LINVPKPRPNYAKLHNFIWETLVLIEICTGSFGFSGDRNESLVYERGERGAPPPILPQWEEAPRVDFGAGN